MSARREDISNALVYTGEGRPKMKRGGQRRNVVTIVLRNYDVTFACPHALSADAGSGESIAH